MSNTENLLQLTYSFNVDEPSSTVLHVEKDDGLDTRTGVGRFYGLKESLQEVLAEHCAELSISFPKNEEENVRITIALPFENPNSMHSVSSGVLQELFGAQAPLEFVDCPELAYKDFNDLSLDNSRCFDKLAAIIPLILDQAVELEVFSAGNRTLDIVIESLSEFKKIPAWLLGQNLAISCLYDAHRNSYFDSYRVWHEETQKWLSEDSLSKLPYVDDLHEQWACAENRAQKDDIINQVKMLDTLGLLIEGEQLHLAAELLSRSEDKSDKKRALVLAYKAMSSVAGCQYGQLQELIESLCAV